MYEFDYMGKGEGQHGVSYIPGTWTIGWFRIKCSVQVMLEPMAAAS
jgi:hypothetical protein